MSTFGPNIGNMLPENLVLHTHNTTQQLYPVSVRWNMEAPHPKTGKRRLTLDATRTQRGTVLFTKLDPRQHKPFTVSREKFISTLRYHKIQYHPFGLSNDGKIDPKNKGAMVLIIDGYHQCESCGEITYKLNNKKHGIVKCQKCPGNPELKRVSEPVRRPTIDDKDANALYDMFLACDPDSIKETPNIVPRIWASYRVDEAPPETAWVMDKKDEKGKRLEALSRAAFASESRIDGTVIAIHKKGAENGSGWRVWISPDGTTINDILKVEDRGIVIECDKTTIKVMHEDEIKDYTVPEHLKVCVKKGSKLLAGTGIAIPASWEKHDVDGKSSLVVQEGSEVQTGQRISEGYTIKPIKLALELETSGIQALSMETTHDEAGEPTDTLGWLSWDSFIGGLSDSYGYDVYLHARKFAKVKNDDNEVRV